ncbi:hypothetical protein Nepgr_016425 [Nepenthes gracilis]|uniref:Uncharacterized protein n=1 Tax=Nepenthes gracilis TaxID=150966 RepID=A0AAD3SPN9_NEPGR|nr:hypothetical protein Nepgr_016425 [Nepenthes gracilis]
MNIVANHKDFAELVSVPGQPGLSAECMEAGNMVLLCRNVEDCPIAIAGAVLHLLLLLGDGLLLSESP